MLCSYCKVPRIADEAPCPNCGAPSPSSKAPVGNIWGRTRATESATDKNRSSNSRKAPPNFQRGNSSIAAKSQELNFPDAGHSGNSEPRVPKPSFETHNTIPTQAQPVQPVQPLEPTEAQSTDQRQALLPVPYQEIPPAARQTTMSLQIIPDQVVEHLLPALPEPATPEMVHLPPIYTEPRPITPKSQAISSFVSLMIVVLFLCGGSVYYANATGKLTFLHQILGDARLPNIQTNQGTKLPDPPDKVDMGPAYNTIPAAATALRIDPKTNFVIEPVKVFSPGQAFYLAFSVISPNNDGRVNTKWYTNNQYFTTVQSKEVIKANSNESGSVSITYPQSAEGSVELYWNDQLAQRLYFVVR